MQRAGPRHTMRPFLPLGASQLTLLSLLFLLWPLPSAVSPRPLPSAVLPPELESALLLLRAAPEDPAGGGGARAEWRRRGGARAQRGDPLSRPLPPFPDGQPPDGVRSRDVGEAEDGGKRNDALTSIAGGLQAISREKGGFGFRFGRKRWTERGRRDERGGSREEEEEEEEDGGGVTWSSHKKTLNVQRASVQ